MNSAAEQITGFKLEDLFDYTFHASCHSCKRDGTPYPILECPVFLTQQNGGSVKDANEVFVHKDGHFYDITFSVSPVGEYGSSGSVIEFRDVSDQRKMEKERLEAILESQQTSLLLQSTEKHKEAMSSFISFICHELRNPLQGITASAEFLLESVVQLKEDLAKDDRQTGAEPGAASTTTTLASKTPDTYQKKMDKLEQMLDNAQDLIANIQACSDHQALIINNTLDLSRLEAGKAEPLIEVIDILAVGAHCITMMTAKAQAKSIRLELADAKRPPIYIYGDATMLTQIILNFISNACKFTPCNGTITLTLSVTPISSNTSTKAQAVVLYGSVQDNGIGMTEVEKGRLFQRFSQGNKKVAQLYGGSGLGLNISKELVRVMGGTINVESARGVGSTFSFTTEHSVPSPVELQRFLSMSSPSTAVTTPMDEQRSLESALDTMTMSDSVPPLHPTIADAAPSTNGMAASTPTSPVSARPAAPRFRLVGVAEDNPINLSFLGKVLKSSGYEHVLCVNGDELLTRFLEPDSTIDVIIADMHMPVLDGLELTRLVRETENTRAPGSSNNTAAKDNTEKASQQQEEQQQRQHPQTKHKQHQSIPIIALSGNALTEQVAEAFEAGVSDYLLKPTKKVDLIKTLRYWEEIVHRGDVHQPMSESAKNIAKSVHDRKPASTGSLET